MVYAWSGSVDTATLPEGDWTVSAALRPPPVPQARKSGGLPN